MTGKRERNVALLKVLAAAAWADGKLDSEEVNRLKELMLAYDMGPEEMRQVEALLEAPVSYSRCEDLTRELLGMLSSNREREEVLAEVENILRADGVVTGDEKEVLEGLRGIMEAMSSVDRFMGRITRVFRRTFSGRDPRATPGELAEYLKNTALQRLHDISGGAWQDETDLRTLNRYTLVGAVLGRVAEAEDGISSREREAIREVLENRLHLESPLLDWVMQAVEESASSHMDRQGLLSEFNRISESGERKQLLDAAFAVAAADGEVSAAELEELRLISNFLWVDPRDFNAIRLQWTRSSA